VTISDEKCRKVPGLRAVQTELARPSLFISDSCRTVGAGHKSSPRPFRPCNFRPGRALRIFWQVLEGVFRCL